MEFLVAPEIARFQDRGANRMVGFRESDAIVDRAGGVADFQPEIPQHVEHVLDHALAPGGHLVGVQEQQVDVGEGRHLAPAVAADRDHREPLAGGRVGRRIGVPGGVVVQQPDQLVIEKRRRPGQLIAGLAA